MLREVKRVTIGEREYSICESSGKISQLARINNFAPETKIDVFLSNTGKIKEFQDAPMFFDFVGPRILRYSWITYPYIGWAGRYWIKASMIDGCEIGKFYVVCFCDK